jgi:hypothetical protein
MDPLAEVRKLRHKKYVKDVVLPNVKEMIHVKKDQTTASVKVLSDGFMRKFIPECVNIDPIEEEHIPPLFRMRMKLNSSNLVKPEIPTVSGDEAQIDFTEVDSDELPDLIFPTKFKKFKKSKTVPIINHTSGYENVDIDDLIAQSKAEYEMNEEVELNKAIVSSLQNTPIAENDDLDNVLLKKAILSSLHNTPVVENDEIDNVLFEKALMDSLAEHVKPDDNDVNPIKETDDAADDENEFYVCFDIRVFGPDPQQPIYFMELPYFFSLSQMDLIRQRWNKVNPDSSTGQKLEQEIEYMHNMAVDLENL